MSKNVSEYLTELQALTKKNLETLRAINQAFYTKAEHLSVTVDDEKFIIPSFLSLENRLNMIQDNFENLVSAPKTGEAVFDFNGNTQQIEMKGFSNTPKPALGSIEKDQYTQFQVNKNQIFKDLCTPQPFVKIELTSIPTDIQEVNVKKIVPKNATLIEQIKSYLSEKTGDTVVDHVSVAFSHSDLLKILYSYNVDTDFVEYDTLYKLPIRGNIGVGTYKVTSINKNWTDNNFNEHYSITLDTLDYFTEDTTIQNTLSVGQRLTCNQDRCKLLIEDVKTSTKTIQVLVEENSYADLTTYDESNVYGELRFLPSQDWTDYKYLNVPLEEDQYVFIFLAPVDRGSLIQSVWGDGILFNTYNLSCKVGDTTYYYKDYYEKFVNNVGDSLTSITDMFDRSLNNITEEQFNRIIGFKPYLDAQDLHVLEINKHLSNSKTVQEIYKLYDQKSKVKNDLEDVQNQIDDLTSKINSINFKDTTQNRTIFEQELKAHQSRKNALSNTLSSLIGDISRAANDTDTPIDNPKYRIRGFYRYQNADNMLKTTGAHVIGMDVQYRYKNATKATGSATTISISSSGQIGVSGSGSVGVFSDWNQMNIVYNKRRAKYEGVTSGFSYAYEGDTTNINEISFNQFDIPIVQGESVDIRFRLIFNIGQPFIEVVSDWSSIINIPFPDELKKNVTVFDILNENNKDFEKTQFQNLMNEHGIIEHADDGFEDQNITYFHQPEHLASGFYTAERRVIPLLDKLKEMDGTIKSLTDEINGTNTESLTVTLVGTTNSTDLVPYSNTVHKVVSYVDANKDVNGYTSETISLRITNSSNHIVKLYSLFPGSSQLPISKLKYYRFPLYDYIDEDGEHAPLWGMVNRKPADCMIPIQNQIIYFRMNSVFNGQEYYSKDDQSYKKDDVICSGRSVVLQPTPYGATLYPVYEKMRGTSNNSVMSNLCVNSADINACKVLQPGESIQVPLMFLYRLSDENPYIQKTMSFDIRTSLYKDPINYSFTVSASFSGTIGDKLQEHKKKAEFDPVIVGSKSIQTPIVAKKKR